MLSQVYAEYIRESDSSTTTLSVIAAKILLVVTILNRLRISTHILIRYLGCVIRYIRAQSNTKFQEEH